MLGCRISLLEGSKTHKISTSSSPLLNCCAYSPGCVCQSTNDISRRQNKEPPWWPRSRRTIVLKWTQPWNTVTHRKEKSCHDSSTRFGVESWHSVLGLWFLLVLWLWNCLSTNVFFINIASCQIGVMQLPFIDILSFKSLKQSTVVDKDEKHSKNTGSDSIWMSIL